MSHKKSLPDGRKPRSVSTVYAYDQHWKALKKVSTDLDKPVGHLVGDIIEEWLRAHHPHYLQ